MRRRALTGLAPIALAMTACATSSEAISEAPTGPEIEEVEIVGKADVGSSDVADGLANHPPAGLIFKSRAHLDRLALEVDRLRVESYYKSIGYFGATVGEPVVRPGEEGRVIIRFPVDEGAPAILRSVLFEGVPADGPSEASLRQLFELESGEHFDYGAYAEAKKKIQAALYGAGYATASVKGIVEVERKRDQVRVRFLLRPGPKARFGETTIERLGKLPEDSIESRIAWKKGEPFDPQVFKVSERRMGELQLLGGVRFELHPETSTEAPDVHVVVSDTTPHEVRLGFGAGISDKQYELHLRAGYVQRDFFDPLLTFRAEVRPAIGVLHANPIQEISQLEFVHPIQATGELQRDDLFIPRLRGVAGALLALDQFEVYSTDTSAGSVSLDRPLLDDLLVASLRAKSQVVHVTAALTDADQLAAGIRPVEILFTLESGLTLDLRDDLLSPKRGAYFDLKGELGRLVTSPTATYLKVTPDARGYVPLGTDRLILAARVRAGATFPTDGYLPITQRYFAGGSEGQRGFGRRQLSPFKTDMNMVSGPIGGGALFDSSVELRLDLFRLYGSWLGIVAFFDAGDVTPTLADLNLRHLYHSIGPGLRYRTPVGPIRLDVGFRINRKGPNDLRLDSGFAIQFSLGEAF